MKIQLKGSLNSARGSSPAANHLREWGGAAAQLLMTTAFVVPVAAALGWGSSAGLRLIQSTRETLRANQIVMQKAECLRLFTRGQVADTKGHSKPLFAESDGLPGATHNPGCVQYAGYLSAGPDVPSAPGAHLRTVAVTVYSTNYLGTEPLVHKMVLHGQLARNGTLKYLWTPL
jgi:hypothetical protein